MTDLREASTQPASTAGTPAARRILVADDRRSSRELLLAMLRPHLHASFTEVGDGTAALAALQNQRWSMAFIDIDMPGMDGLSILQTLGARVSDTFLVMVSAHSSAANVKRALTLGAKGFVVKPYSEQRVIDVVRRHVVESRDVALLRGAAK